LTEAGEAYGVRMPPLIGELDAANHEASTSVRKLGGLLKGQPSLDAKRGLGACAVRLVG